MYPRIPKTITQIRFSSASTSNTDTVITSIRRNNHTVLTGSRIIPYPTTPCQFAASGRLLLFFQRFSVSKRPVRIRHACRGRIHKHRQHRQRHGRELKRIAQHRHDLLPQNLPRGKHGRLRADRRQHHRHNAHPKPRVFHSHRNIDLHAIFAPFTVPRARAGTRSPPQALPR